MGKILLDLIYQNVRVMVVYYVLGDAGCISDVHIYISPTGGAPFCVVGLVPPLARFWQRDARIWEDL